MDLLPMLIVIVIVIISNVYSYENITLFNIYAFYLVYCVWLHWETEVLEALTEFLMLLPAILHPCWFCFKHLNSINLIHDYNLMLSPLGLPAYHWTWRLSWGPLRPVINHWPSGIEGFLGVHLITGQEHSEKLPWVHHNTYRMNQKHKEMLILRKIFLHLSNRLIM